MVKLYILNLKQNHYSENLTTKTNSKIQYSENMSLKFINLTIEYFLR